jgi:hypothetical protein
MSADVARALANPPGAASSSSSGPVAVDPVSVVRAFYRGGDGVLHQTYVGGGAWRDASMAVPMSGDKVGAVVDGRGVPRAFYRGADGLAHQTYVGADGKWHDISMGVSAAAGTGFAAVSDKSGVVRALVKLTRVLAPTGRRVTRSPAGG